MKYEKPIMVELAPPLKAIHAFVKPSFIFLDALFTNRLTNGAYEADE